MEEKLNYLEAYKAMFCFLEKYYNQTGSDDVGSLLGSMQILEDKSTADPAIWNDWKDCIEKPQTKKFWKVTRKDINKQDN